MPSLRNALQQTGATSVLGLRADLGSKRLSVRDLLAFAAIKDFHTGNLGILVVGSPTEDIERLENGGHLQRFEFGTLVKPLGAPPDIATRYAATISLAAIKCFGTDDPSGEDEPYVVSAIYGVDPTVREHAVKTNEIHFGPKKEKAVFAKGDQLTLEPIWIPGDGHIQMDISLWDEESARPSALQDKWRTLATAAIIGGLTLLNPAIGGAAAALEAAKGIVTDASRELITAVSDFLGLSDDHIGTQQFTITPDYLKRLIADGSGLSRTSPAIPGVAYNFPEVPETDDWLFEGGGGTYRIFFTVQAAELQFSPIPHI